MDRHFYVYMLRCSDGSYYTGHTDDLDARLWQHRNGMGCEWTQRRRPVELVWCDVMPTRDEAFAAEHRIKPWSRAKKEALIAGDWPLVGYFAKPPHERPCQRPSTSLGTSDVGALKKVQENPPTPLVPSEVEGRGPGLAGNSP